MSNYTLLRKVMECYAPENLTRPQKIGSWHLEGFILIIAAVVIIIIIIITIFPDIKTLPVMFPEGDKQCVSAC